MELFLWSVIDDLSGMNSHLSPTKGHTTATEPVPMVWGGEFQLALSWKSFFQAGAMFQWQDQLP